MDINEIVSELRQATGLPRALSNDFAITSTISDPHREHRTTPLYLIERGCIITRPPHRSRGTTTSRRFDLYILGQYLAPKPVSLLGSDWCMSRTSKLAVRGGNSLLLTSWGPLVDPMNQSEVLRYGLLLFIIRISPVLNSTTETYATVRHLDSTGNYRATLLIRRVNRVCSSSYYNIIFDHAI